MFSTVGLESRAAGNALVLAPVLDLSRDPRFGRVEEMYSEDPYLVGAVGSCCCQGPARMRRIALDENHVFATAKHFVHAQPENGTNVGPTDFSERTMRSVFLYPFEQVVKNAHIEAVMPSYNENNGGIPSHANSWLLKDVLRKEWGFTGLTVSDYLPSKCLPRCHHVLQTMRRQACLPLSPDWTWNCRLLPAFLRWWTRFKSGKVKEKDLDEAVGRVLTAKFRAGLFEQPYVDEGRASGGSR